jgi:hypothetical protein
LATCRQQPLSPTSFLTMSADMLPTIGNMSACQRFWPFSRHLKRQHSQLRGGLPTRVQKKNYNLETDKFTSTLPLNKKIRSTMPHFRQELSTVPHFWREHFQNTIWRENFKTIWRKIFKRTIGKKILAGTFWRESCNIIFTSKTLQNAPFSNKGFQKLNPRNSLSFFCPICFNIASYVWSSWIQSLKIPSFLR